MWNFQFLLFSLSLNVILTFLLIFHFRLIIKSYYYDFTKLFWAIFFFIKHCNLWQFWKKYICYITIPFFQILLNVTFISILTWWYQCCWCHWKDFLWKIKINPKSWFCVFNSSHSYILRVTFASIKYF